jgi:L-ascorbate 6-phosphate lactonase
MKTGTQLITAIEACTPAEGHFAFWWLGQQSFVIKLAGKTCYFDLFLSPLERRRVTPMLAPSDVTQADYVFGSHDHADHIDRSVWPAIAAASPHALFVVPSLLLPELACDLDIPLRRFIGVDGDDTIDAGPIRITGIPAAHEFLDRDEATGRYPYLGYVVEGGGVTLYHAGDTCLYEGLHARLRRWKLDAAFLPINGRDARRLAANCIGNMTYQEAADLAGSLAPRLTLPTHYDMFAMNSEDPDLFMEYMKVKYPDLKAVLCEYGEGVQV